MWQNGACGINVEITAVIEFMECLSEFASYEEANIT